MIDTHPTLLVVEDDAQLSEMLATILGFEGYVVISVRSGQAAVQSAMQTPPDLIILDLNLPDISGFQVITSLRTDPKTMHVPVIILSARADMQDKVLAFNQYVNDYLTKPFHSSELLARVRAHMYHAHTPTLSPLTALPGGVMIEYAITKRLAADAEWAFLYLDLDHFKALNDAYGFLRGNEMIQLLTRVIIEEVQQVGNPSDFVGHIGGEDFVVLTTPDRAEPLCQAIIEQFRQESRQFYRADDIARGMFFAKGRDDIPRYFPLVTISIAVLLSSSIDPTVTIDDLSHRAAQVKARSKAVSGNSYVIDGQPPVYIAFDDADS